MKLYLDEDLPPAIAAALRRRGVDAVSAHEVGNVGLPDAEQLRWASQDGRCLVTRNRRDFTRLSREAVRVGQPHAGIVFCPSSLRGAEVGAIAEALLRLARRYPRGLGEYDVIYL